MTYAHNFTHLRRVYYRPSWQGGDTQQPKCMAPVAGWAGPNAAALRMTDIPGDVTCSDCLRVKAERVARVRERRIEGEPELRAPNHAKHLRLISRALDGMSFPTLRVPTPAEPPPPPTATAADIIREVAARHGLTVGEILSPTRARRIAHPRQEAMWELRQRTKLSFPQIASRVGLTDHSAAMHGFRAHAKRLAALTPQVAA